MAVLTWWSCDRYRQVHACFHCWYDLNYSVLELCQTQDACLSSHLKVNHQLSWPQWGLCSKAVVLFTVSVQTGEAAGSSQPVPPVPLLPLIRLRWKDLLRGRLQSWDGGAGPLWRGKSKRCRAQKDTHESGEERGAGGRDEDSGGGGAPRQKTKDGKIIGGDRGKRRLKWCSHTINLWCFAFQN